MIVINIKWLTKQQDLNSACNYWQQLPVIALDTEFMRTNTFYPKLGLIQITDGLNVWLIDPLTIDDWQALASVLTNSKVIKAVHSGTEDVEVLAHTCQVVPNNLFDTQIAAAFLQLGFSVGLSKLVKLLFNIELDKQQTLTNWLIRPLTNEQVQYAALDAFYVYKLYLNLSQQLNSNKLNWVLEESLNSNINLNNNDLKFNIKSSWKLNEQQLMVLYDLYLMREKIAKFKNLPRNWVLTNDDLYDLVVKKPQNINELNVFNNNFKIKKYSKQILNCINNSLQQDINSYNFKINKPLTKSKVKLLKKIKEQITNYAVTLKIEPQLLMPKKILIEAVRTNKIPSSLIGFKQELLQDLLSQALK